MIVLLALAAAISGVALVRAAAPQLGWTFGASAGAIVGLGLSGTLWSAGLLLFGATGPGSDLVLVALGASLLALRWRGDMGRPERGSAPAALVWFCAAAALVVTLLFAEQSIRYPDGGWDARAIWNLRARALFGAPDRLADVFSPELSAQHPGNPLLLPGLVAHAWFALGSRTQAAPIAISFLFAAAGAAALGSAVAARRGRTAGLCAALVLLGTPIYLTLAVNQYADLKLAMLLLVAAVLATEGSPAGAGFVAGLAAYTKNEGPIESGALLLAVLAVVGWRAAERFAAGATLPVALLVFFNVRWAPAYVVTAQFKLHDALVRAPRRIGAVAASFAGQLIEFGSWGCALAAVVAVWIATWRGRERRSIGAWFLLLSLLAFYGVYLATPLDLEWHLRNSLDRLLFQLWPCALYTTASLAFADRPGATPAPLERTAQPSGP